MQNLGEIANRLLEIDSQITALKAEHKAELSPLEQEYKDLEDTLVSTMQSIGLTEVATPAGDIECKSQLRVSFADFDQFIEFARNQDCFHLFERRISTKAYAELKEALGGQPLPGLSEFMQARLNVRPKKA